MPSYSIGFDVSSTSGVLIFASKGTSSAFGFGFVGCLSFGFTACSSFETGATDSKGLVSFGAGITTSTSFGTALEVSTLFASDCLGDIPSMSTSNERIDVPDLLTALHVYVP